MVAETKTKQSPIPSYVIARIVCHRRPDNGPTVYHAVPCLLPFQDTHPSPAQRASTTLVGHTEGGEGQKRVYRGRRDIKFENNPRRDLIRSRVICNQISSSRHDSSPISMVDPSVRRSFLFFFFFRSFLSCAHFRLLPRFSLLSARSHPRVAVPYRPQIKIKAIKYLN